MKHYKDDQNVPTFQIWLGSVNSLVTDDRLKTILGSQQTDVSVTAQK